MDKNLKEIIEYKRGIFIMHKKKWMKIGLAVVFFVLLQKALSGGSGRKTYTSVRIGDYRDSSW